MPSQFHDLLLAEMPRLRGYAMVLTRNKTVADDLLQETALRAWKGQAQFTMGTNFRAWIYHILRNEFISICRRAKRAPLPVDGIAENLFSYEGDQEEKVIAREVVQAMAKLPTPQREALYLKCVGDYTYEEVATALQCSIGTVKSRLWRARNAMQKMILDNNADVSEVAAARPQDELAPLAA
ncbi:MAG: RNA polymerase sigma factor [Rhodospirillaceae bacterium]